MSWVAIAGLVCAAQTTPDTMPPNSWLSVPNTKMSAVAPAPGQFPGTWAIVGPNSVIIAWCGGALDTRRNRLVLWGGGHADYYGNELYSFDIPTLRWSRLNDPFVNPVMDEEVNADGTPNSRHTYGGLTYIAHADRFFGQAGALAGSGFARCDRTWTFDFAAGRWEDRKPPGATAGGGAGVTCSYDPTTRKVWWGCDSTTAPGGLWSYDYDSNAWTRHSSDNIYEHTSTVDTKRGLWVAVGNGQVVAYDLRSGNFTQQTWTTTGAGALIAKTAPGVDYDPVSDRIVAWHGGAVYALDLDTKVWTAYNPPGAPPTTGNGIYNRWKYVPSVNAFIVVTDWEENVHFYKFTAGGGVPPSSDTTPPVVTITSPGSGPAPSNPATVTGTASDAGGITSVTWTNAATGASGTATGTTSWTADIPLVAGANVITVTATDMAGNSASATVTLDVAGGVPAPTPPPANREGKNGDGALNDGLCGLLGAEGLVLAAAALLLKGRFR